MEINVKNISVGVAKEYSTYAHMCVVRAVRTYDHTLALILYLFKIAKNDFKELKPEDVAIVLYGGDRIKGTWGIEFLKDESVVPKTYSRVDQLEYKLG